MSKPIVILLATYNGARYINALLESLEAQTRKDFRLLVRDDGSTDNTLSYIHARKSNLDIELVPSRGRLGAAHSFMELLEYASSAYEAYLFADQDDVWMPQKVERATQALARHQHTPTLYCTRQSLVGAELEPLGLSVIPRYLDFHNAVVENVVTGCTMAINASLRDLVLYEGQPFGYRMHDAWIYLVSSAFGHVEYDPWPSVLYRQHDANTIGSTLSSWRRAYASARRVMRYGNDVAPISGPAQAFLQRYGHRLDPVMRRELQLLKGTKCNTCERLKLSLYSRFRRQRRIDHVILRVLFLLGRF